MYHFSDEVDWSIFFRFDKRWIENMNWARISPSAKAVLPVIACHCNERGESFPGEETIAALAGLTAKSVRKAIKVDLDGFPGFDWSYYLTKRGKRGKRFLLKFPPKREKGRAFFFFRGIMDGGIWRELKPSAQALYPVMRYFARYDDGEDETLDDLDTFDERYEKRKWESCSAKIKELEKYSGINRRSIHEALRSLEKNFLIETDADGAGEKTWKVYIEPKKYWKASFLNQSLKNQAVS